MLQTFQSKVKHGYSDITQTGLNPFPSIVNAATDVNLLTVLNY